MVKQCTKVLAALHYSKKLLYPRKEKRSAPRLAPYNHIAQYHNTQCLHQALQEGMFYLGTSSLLLSKYLEIMRGECKKAVRPQGKNTFHMSRMLFVLTLPPQALTRAGFKGISQLHKQSLISTLVN